MKKYLAISLVLAATCQFAVAETKGSVKAAGFADKHLALYFEADYIVPTAKSKANLRVVTAKVILIVADGGSAKPKRMEMRCENSEAMLSPFQNSSYGRGSEGSVIGLECAPQGQFIFTLLRDFANGTSSMKSGSCEKSSMLNTPPVALATSFGHQAFCMEDWSAVADPSSQLETQFSKLQER